MENVKKYLHHPQTKTSVQCPDLQRSIHWIEKSKKERYAGLHLLAEFWRGKQIEDPKKIETILVEAAKKANASPLEVSVHKFDPQGITGFVVLKESHISIHTWPEEHYIAVDVFTCGDKSLPHAAIEHLEKEFAPQKIEIQETKRGKVPTGEASKSQDQTNSFCLMDGQQFGQELVLNLYDCKSEYIKSKEKILEFSDKLCEQIEMKKYKEPIIERFALHSEISAGYSLAQMIETSLISGHFSEYCNSAHINIFSCKKFDVKKAINFTKEFFKAQRVKSTNLIR